MMMIFKEFRFEAAHFLDKLPRGHKCHNMHGHQYIVRIELSGDLDPTKGWVRDYGDIAKAWAPLHEQLDHHILNEIDGLEVSTAENLALWVAHYLKVSLPELSAVEIRETSTAGVRYELRK